MKWVTCWILCVAIVADQADRGLASSRLLTPCVPQTTHFNVSLLYSDTLVVLADSSQCSSPFQPYSVKLPFVYDTNRVFLLVFIKL